MTTQLDVLVECPSCRDRFPQSPRTRRCPTCGEALEAQMGEGPKPARMPGPEVPGAPENRLSSAATFAAVEVGQPAGSNRVALAMAALAALAGAFLWAVIIQLTGYEVGYLAWGLGLLVGGACVRFGGRGPVLATACAALTVGAILAGKYVYVRHEVANLCETLGAQLTPAAHAEAGAAAAALAAIPAGADDDTMRTYLVDHGFSEAGEAAEVSDAELAAFREVQEPALREFHAAQPGFEEWKEGLTGAMQDQVPVMDIVVENLQGMDLLFALLGLTTAFGIVMGATRRAGLA
jgi:hypothetical protein